MEIGLIVMPKDATLIGISYEECTCEYKEKMTSFHKVGIGIGILVLYLIFYKKGGN